MSRASVSRRALLGGAAATLFAAPMSVDAARGAPPRRVAVVDWALLETLLALGHAPAAAVELVLFRELAVEPAVPESVADLGLRGSINFELVATIAPDLIYGSNYSGWANPLLRRIAPVRELVIYQRGEKPYPKAQAAMRAIGTDLGLEARAETYIAQLDAELAASRRRAARHAGRPLLIANLGDSRHFRAFGDDSMFGEIGARLGFANAWGPRTSYSATAPVGIERLAQMPEAILAIVGPVPPDARRALPESALWQAMPQVKGGRVLMLPPVNAFGGLPAGRRFAGLLSHGLEAL